MTVNVLTSTPLRPLNAHRVQLVRKNEVLITNIEIDHTVYQDVGVFREGREAQGDSTRR